MEWAKGPEVRDQMVLFPQRLDDVISLDHHVRLMDDILSRLDWSRWEAACDLRRGQPPIPPRVIASIILNGNLTRIRSSRKLEEALQVRLDFRWLVEGRSIDHTTISNFRRSREDALCDTFPQRRLHARSHSERLTQQSRHGLAVGKRSAGLEIVKDNDGRTEQRGIHRVEVMIRRFEETQKRLPVCRRRV